MKTLTVENDLDTVDTLTRLTAQGSVSAPSRVTPSNSKRIMGILASVAPDGAVEGSGVFLIRLGGAAVQNGEQTIVFAAAGTNTAQAGSDPAPGSMGLFKLENADIEIMPSSVISVSAEMMGEDLGSSNPVVTIIYE